MCACSAGCGFREVKLTFFGAGTVLTSCSGDTLPVFHPEFGRFMLEATPGKPWGIGFKDLLDVEQNMKWRYVFTHFQCLGPILIQIGGSLPKST